MRRQIRHFFRIAAPLFIAVLLLAVLFCFVNQWDRFVIITLIPIWAWAVVGGLASMFFAFVLKSRSCIALFFLWLVVGVSLSDESRSLGREFWVAVSSSSGKVDESERVFRIVSINCSKKTLEAAAEIRALKPDIVFLQEAPEKSVLEPLLREIFEGQGDYVSHLGNAILARGNFEKPIIPSAGNGTFRIRLNSLDGVVFELANVHLERAIPRLDIWKGEAWKEFTKTRIENRTLLRHLLRNREENSPSLIVGGDFSTPPGDDIFRMLKKANLEDASVNSVGGSGNTYPANFAVIRIDQFWLSEDLIPVKINAVRSEFTDHKMLVCDFIRRRVKK